MSINSPLPPSPHHYVGHLEAVQASALVTKARQVAVTCHAQTIHTYDGKPYETHLQAVMHYACKYAYLIPEEALEIVLAAAWAHNTLEGCRQS
ncbi:MAG TPA: hypothetical protein PKD90_02920 [Phnomibacter sp.]|nr:hypothetical protein [Phnomibacter sp.]